MSARQRRRAELAASLAGVENAVDPPAAPLPRRDPGTHYRPATHRELDDADMQFLLCDGGFTELVRAAEAISARRERRAELP